MPVIEWKEPALVWNGALPQAGRARILEIRSDDFIPQFLQGMAGSDPAAYFQDHQIDATFDLNEPLKLYQPLHGCYYLVTASLVCRQVGLPDKAIDRAADETVSFVIRRRTETGEEAWIALEKEGYWQPLPADQILTLAPGEEQHPMHPVRICPKPETPQSVFTDHIERDLHYGYIPTGNRDKYKDTIARATDPTTPAQTMVNDFIRQAEADNATFNFRVELFRRRIYIPWGKLLATSTIAAGAPTTIEEQWLYTLVELGDFIKYNLPTLWAAVEENDETLLSGKTTLTNLFLLLRDTLEVEQDETAISLRQALIDLEPSFDLVRGDGDPPAATYTNGNVGQGHLNTLLSQVRTALDDGEEDQPIQLPDGADSELARLIGHQVQPSSDTEPSYHIRAVYRYDPDCPPIVSTLPSQPFYLTKFFEPDAPARLVRLEAPSLKPKDLRKYARGVGIEMNPELHKLASCLGGEDVQGVIDSAASCDSEDGSLSIQMICTFSIQIIFLVAFIVMFIFLIALNFIFWWLAYLRICLPIPKKG